MAVGLSMRGARRLQRDGPTCFPSDRRTGFASSAPSARADAPAAVGPAASPGVGDAGRPDPGGLRGACHRAHRVPGIQVGTRPQALRELSSPRACVLRDGQARGIAARELVVGDVIVVAEGDRVPADARVLEANGMMLDESMLTGESVPVRRSAAPGGEAEGNLIRASTLVVGGRLGRNHRHRPGYRGRAIACHCDADRATDAAGISRANQFAARAGSS